MISGASIALTGLAILAVGAILTNLAVSKMAKRVNLHWEVGYKSSSADRRSREVIQKYREQHGNDSLYNHLKLGYWVCGIGGILTIAGALIEKK